MPEGALGIHTAYKDQCPRYHEEDKYKDPGIEPDFLDLKSILPMTGFEIEIEIIIESRKKQKCRNEKAILIILSLYLSSPNFRTHIPILLDHRLEIQSDSQDSNL